MEFNVTQNLNNLLPWDFALVYEGSSYPTLRPRISTLGSLKNLKSLDDDAAIAALGSIFAGEKPDVGAWSMEEMQLSVGAYLAYMDEQVRKNSLTVAALVKPKTDATSTKSSST